MRPSRHGDTGMFHALGGWLPLVGQPWAGHWPHRMPVTHAAMQLRALACLAIVAVVRLLNLAIPILYRDVINTLAATSDATHPKDGRAPHTFSFKQVGRCQEGCAVHVLWCMCGGASITEYDQLSSLLGHAWAGHGSSCSHR